MLFLMISISTIWHGLNHLVILFSLFRKLIKVIIKKINFSENKKNIYLRYLKGLVLQQKYIKHISTYLCIDQYNILQSFKNKTALTN